MASPNHDEPLVASFEVKLNGQALDPNVAVWIATVSVEDDLNLPSMFSFQLISQSDEQGSMAWTDDEQFALGTRVEVSMGYGDERAALICGEITALEPEFGVAGPPTLLVRGYDQRHRLNGARRTRSFTDQKDSDVATQIAGDAGLTVTATDSEVTHAYILQADQTDLEFLLERARRIHYELAMDGDTLLFRPAAHAEAEVVTLTFEDDLLEFRPRLALVPLTELKVLGWDVKEKQAISAGARAGDEVSTMGGGKSAAQQAGDFFSAAVETVVRVPVASQAEADQLAMARFNATALDCIRGEGRCHGRTDVRAGTVIRVDELGSRFSGQYYVTGVLHRYTHRDGYVTDFRVRRNAS